MTKNELLEVTECLPPCTYHQYNVVSKEPVAEGFGGLQMTYNRVDRYPGVFRLQVRAGEQRGHRGEGGAPLRRAVPGGGAGRGAGALPRLLLPHPVGPGGGSARCHQQIHEVEVI